jgi:hypothetical protein
MLERCDTLQDRIKTNSLSIIFHINDFSCEDREVCAARTPTAMEGTLSLHGRGGVLISTPENRQGTIQAALSWAYKATSARDISTAQRK